MIRALTTAATGLEAQQANIERISNDMANVNTDGYKRSRTEFQDLMYETVKEPGATLGANSMSPVGVQIGMGVKVGATHKIFEQGPAKVTDNMFDILVNGKGFLPVQLINGEVGYTRNGAFHLDGQGRLMLSNGAQMIPPVTVPSDSTHVGISPQGEIKSTNSQGGETVIGQIQLVDFVNMEGLVAQGDSIYKPSLATGNPVQGIPGENGLGVLQQGALEGSNVNVANSMVDMITTQRAYEMGTKVMGVADQMLNATVNIK